MKFNYTTLIFVLFIAQASYAGDENFNAGFDQGMKTAATLQGKAYTAIQEFKPEKFIKNYSSNPKEVNYQNNPDSIQQDGVHARESEATGKSILQGMEERNKQFNYPIDLNSVALKNIANNADGIYQLVTGNFKDCTKQTACKLEYETKVCEEAPKTAYQYCRKILNVSFTSKQVVTTYPLTVSISTKYHDYAGAMIDLTNGRVLDSGPHDSSFSLTGRLPMNLECQGLQGKVTATNSDNPNTYIDSLNFPSCSSGNLLNIHVSNKGRKGTVKIDIKLDIISTKIIQEPQDTWDDLCLGLKNSLNCTLKEEHCVSTQTTRIIQNMPITRDCWEKELSYHCGGSQVISSCQTYRDQGCEQVGSSCLNQTDGGCALFQQTLRCPIKQCQDVGLICSGQTYCLSGDCVKQQKQADPDFQKSVSSLSAINDAAKSYAQNQGAQFPIFSGQVKTCNKDLLDFANCCSDNGWGVDLHLGQCDLEAKELGTAKEKGLVSYVDSNEDCVLGICSHKRRYCVFPSKLARIIQEQGRHEQLHLSFGNFEHPDCRGLTPEEFSHLDLNKMDLSEIYAELTQKEELENSDHLNQRLGEKMKDWTEGGRAYE